MQRPACTLTGLSPRPRWPLSPRAPSQPTVLHMPQHSTPSGSKVFPSWSAHPPSRGHDRMHIMHSETLSSSHQACLGGTQPPDLHDLSAYQSALRPTSAWRPLTHVFPPQGRVRRRLGEAGASSLPSSLPCSPMPPSQHMSSSLASGALSLLTHQPAHALHGPRPQPTFPALRRQDDLLTSPLSPVPLASLAEHASTPVLRASALAQSITSNLSARCGTYSPPHRCLSSMSHQPRLSLGPRPLRSLVLGQHVTRACLSSPSALSMVHTSLHSALNRARARGPTSWPLAGTSRVTPDISSLRPISPSAHMP